MELKKFLLLIGVLIRYNGLAKFYGKIILAIFS